MFTPASVALVGASARAGSVGHVVLSNLQSGGFSGQVFAVNPKYKDIQGVTCYPDVASLPFAPDMAV
ncbi:MAG: CoA-binding protein, partial [Rickettsiales bacterium]|nr:CoA-binding protein [Rickettsiales bacterium]